MGHWSASDTIERGELGASVLAVAGLDTGRKRYRAGRESGGRQDAARARSGRARFAGPDDARRPIGTEGAGRRRAGDVTKQASAGAAGWRSPTRPRSPSSPTPTPPPGWTRPDASLPWRGSWERRGTIRCPMEGLPSRRRGGEPGRLSTVVENLSILDTRRCARLGHRSSRVDLDGDEDDGCGRFLRVPPRAALRRTGRVCQRTECDQVVATL